MEFDYNFAVQIIVISLIVLILVALVMQYSSKTNSTNLLKKRANNEQINKNRKEEFQDNNNKQQREQVFPKIVQPMKATDDKTENENDNDVKPSELENNEDYQAIDFSNNDNTSDCYPKDRLTKDDLLPKDAANSLFAQVNPAGQGSVEDGNLLSAGHHMGINTVGNSLRNANYQLRSDPPIPKIPNLSPWNNTTIEYDSNRRPFEIGSV